jgi:phosphoribosyl 1,2-cyclic phosphodiesterase
MALSFTLLGSGSSGNATLVSDGDTHILVDIGLSGKETARRLRECGVEPEQVSAIVLSHEHGDHCRGAGPFIKGLKIPVFMTEGAYEASGLTLPCGMFRRIDAGAGFEIGNLQFTPFAVPHDAADPIGMTVERDGVKIAIVLDLGYVSNLVAERLKGCDGIILESNHDLNMLKVGPYPWALKQRVMSRRGHLSNDGVAEFLANGFDGRARHVLLAHLSKKNWRCFRRKERSRSVLPFPVVRPASNLRTPTGSANRSSSDFDLISGILV